VPEKGGGTDDVLIAVAFSENKNKKKMNVPEKARPLTMV
jgi:hypothetical protein